MIACHKCYLLSIMQVDNTYNTIYHIHACILKLSLRDKHKPKVRQLIYVKNIYVHHILYLSSLKTFYIPLSTSKHYLRNNIPVFESIHSMLNLLSTKNKALLLTTFQIPGINMQNIHTQKVKSCIQFRQPFHI